MPTLGFEIAGHPQAFVRLELQDGILPTNDTIMYEDITADGTPTKAIKFKGEYFMFNSSTQQLEAQDIVDEGVEIVQGYASQIIRIDKNLYVRKHAFDCKKESNEENTDYQPINGLLLDAVYLSIRTENFCNVLDRPKPEDILFYQGAFWIIQETNKSFVYTPREKMTLHISMKQIKK